MEDRKPQLLKHGKFGSNKTQSLKGMVCKI